MAQLTTLNRDIFKNNDEELSYLRDIIAALTQLTTRSPLLPFSFLFLHSAISNPAEVRALSQVLLQLLDNFHFTKIFKLDHHLSFLSHLSKFTTLILSGFSDPSPENRELFRESFDIVLQIWSKLEYSIPKGTSPPPPIIQYTRQVFQWYMMAQIKYSSSIDIHKLQHSPPDMVYFFLCYPCVFLSGLETSCESIKIDCRFGTSRFNWFCTSLGQVNGRNFYQITIQFSNKKYWIPISILISSFR